MRDCVPRGIQVQGDMRSAWPLIALLMLHGMNAGSAVATPVWYSDTEAVSANGRYVTTSKSPENRKRHPEPFQSNFTIELRDTATNSRLWRFKTGKDSEPGGALYVADDGTVIRIGVHDTLWLIRPTGVQIKLGNAFSLLPEDETDAYCDHTTAGVFWTQYSWRTFITIDGREYFFLRTFWGRYLVIDLEKEELCNQVSVARKIESRLLKSARNILTADSESYWTPCKSCGGRHPASSIARDLLVLELHKIKGRERIIRAYRCGNDDSQFGILDHVERIRNRGQREEPSR